MTPTEPREGAGVRFSGPRGIYLAVRHESCWHVTLEGNTDRWMYWLVSDEAMQKNLLESRLTE